MIRLALVVCIWCLLILLLLVVAKAVFEHWEIYEEYKIRKALENEKLLPNNYKFYRDFFDEIWELVLSLHTGVEKIYLESLPKDNILSRFSWTFPNENSPFPTISVITTLVTKEDREQFEIVLAEIFKKYIGLKGRKFEQPVFTWYKGKTENTYWCCVYFALTFSERKNLKNYYDMVKTTTLQKASAALQPVSDPELEKEYELWN